EEMSWHGYEKGEKGVRYIFRSIQRIDRTRRKMYLTPFSFDVLDLLAHLLDEHLELDGNARHLVRHGFRAERVRLAIELLAEEIQPLSARAATVEHAAEFADVRAQARDLLVHVDARCVENDLLV